MRADVVVATARVCAEWQRRVEVEYRSAALTHELTFWLIQAGMSPDLIRAGLAIVDDELVHAELAHETAQLAAESASAVVGARVIDRAQLVLPRALGEPLEHDIARTCAGMFCLGETVAVPIFRALREGSRVPVARRALTRVLADEVRHRDFGWTLLAALVPNEALRALVERELPALIESVRRTYAAEEAHDADSDDERAWGLMPPAEYQAIFERTLEKELLPKFAQAGIKI